MSVIVLRVDGKPHGKGRPRFVRATGRTYTDQQTTSAEQRVHAAWHAAGRPRLPLGAAALEVELVVDRPQAHIKRDGSLSAAGQRADWPIRKPDADNALKLIMDALNGCAYRDDVDIVSASVVRRWATAGEHEHTVIRLRPMSTDAEPEQLGEAA
jgi:Holliday junction resolvase RusA-like endonuclease